MRYTGKHLRLAAALVISLNGASLPAKQTTPEYVPLAEFAYKLRDREVRIALKGGELVEGIAVSGGSDYVVVQPKKGSSAATLSRMRIALADIGSAQYRLRRKSKSRDTALALVGLTGVIVLGTRFGPVIGFIPLGVVGFIAWYSERPRWVPLVIR